MRLWRLTPGDWVIYRKPKLSESPGPRAQEVIPSPAGDTYRYKVEKFWIVDEILADGRVRLRTRRGKQHLLDQAEPRLRKARWWERLLYKDRFAAVEEATDYASETAETANS